MPSRESFYHYLPVDDLAMRWGSYFTGAGRYAFSPGKPYPPPGHPSLYDFEWKRGRTLPEFQSFSSRAGGACSSPARPAWRRSNRARSSFSSPGSGIAISRTRRPAGRNAG